MDSWFLATENFEFITGKGRHFIAALKDSRRIAVTDEDRKGAPEGMPSDVFQKQ
jgi:hypothetical protein